MKSVLCSCLTLLAGAVALADPAAAGTFAYTLTYTCLNSSSGFTSNLEPKKLGTAWTEAFTGLGTGSSNGGTITATEQDQSLITAVDGVKAATNGGAAGAANVTLTATRTGPNSDGSFTIQLNTVGGTYIAGPNSGLTFSATTSGVQWKAWDTQRITVLQGLVGLQAAVGTPVIQTVTLSNNTSYERICTYSNVASTPLTSQ